MDRFLVKWAKSLPIIISCKSLRWHEFSPNQRYHIQATDQDQYLSFALCFGDLKIKEKCNLLLGGSLTLLHFHWLQTKRLGNKVSNVNRIVLLLRYILLNNSQSLKYFLEMKYYVVPKRALPFREENKLQTLDLSSKTNFHCTIFLNLKALCAL